MSGSRPLRTRLPGGPHLVPVALPGGPPAIASILVIIIVVGGPYGRRHMDRQETQPPTARHHRALDQARVFGFESQP